MSYDNSNKGVLFKNDRKATEKHPDYTGTININGVDHYLSAWLKEGKNGKFMSLRIGNPKGQKHDSHNQANSNGYQPQTDNIGAVFDDDPFGDKIPFMRIMNEYVC